MAEMKTLYIPSWLVLALISSPDDEVEYAGTLIRLGKTTQLSEEPNDYADLDGEPLHYQRVYIVDASDNVWMSTIIYKCRINHLPEYYRMFEYFYLCDEGLNDA